MMQKQDKALSGFGNITDEYHLWGIDARKTLPRDIDTWSSIDPRPSNLRVEAADDSGSPTRQ